MAADVDLCRQCNHDREVFLTNLGKAIVQHILPKKHFDQFGQRIGKDKHWLVLREVPERSIRHLTYLLTTLLLLLVVRAVEH